MRTVSGKTPKSPQNAAELALDLVAYMATSGPIEASTIREKEAALLRALRRDEDEALLDAACARARAAGDGVPVLRVSPPSRRLVAGARIEGQEHAGSPCSCGNPRCPSGARMDGTPWIERVDPSSDTAVGASLRARNERDRMLRRIDDLIGRCDELEAQRDAANDELGALVQDRANLQARCVELTRELEKERATSDRMTTAAREAIVSSQRAEGERDELWKHAGELERQRDGARNHVAELARELEAVKARLASTQAEVTA